MTTCPLEINDPADRFIVADWYTDQGDEATAKALRGFTTVGKEQWDWLNVWRNGFAPQWTTLTLHALANALAADSPKLLQGATTEPPPLRIVQDWPCEAADIIASCGWWENGWVTVGDVEEGFAKACYEADKRLGEPAMSRHFLNWWDDVPRPVAFAIMLTEVRRELKQRRKVMSSLQQIHCPTCGPVNPMPDTWEHGVAVSGICPQCKERLYCAPADRQLTPEEAQAAYDAAEPVPLSEERIREIVDYATGKAK